MHDPLILLTNDDGIDAPGLEVLARGLDGVGEVIIAAPAQEQSAVGHGLTLHQPLRIITRGAGQFAITGTPADAVLLAVVRLCPRRPDLIISGINYGLNLGTDIFYSGTLAGAHEGAFRGVQALAVSQEIPQGSGSAPSMTELFERTAAFTRALTLELLRKPLPPKTILNINAPASQTRQYAWTVMGQRVYREQVEQRVDLKETPNYWIGGSPIKDINPPGTDAYAVEHEIISVTPLGLDLSVELPDPPGDLDGFGKADGIKGRGSDTA